MPRGSGPRHVLACASVCPCSRLVPPCSSWVKRSGRKSVIRSITFLPVAKIFSVSGPGTETRCFVSTRMSSRSAGDSARSVARTLTSSISRTRIALLSSSGERRRGSDYLRESQQHAVRKRLRHREGSASYSHGGVEGNLQQQCCKLRRPEHR